MGSHLVAVVAVSGSSGVSSNDRDGNLVRGLEV